VAGGANLESTKVQLIASEILLLLGCSSSVFSGGCFTVSAAQHPLCMTNRLLSAECKKITRV
jgi:hypothetical protein